MSTVIVIVMMHRAPLKDKLTRGALNRIRDFLTPSFGPKSFASVTTYM